MTRVAICSGPAVKIAWLLTNLPAPFLSPHSVCIKRKRMKDVTPHAHVENCILSALSDEERARLLPRLEASALAAGQVIYEVGNRIGYVYFLNSGLASLVSYTQ